MLLLTKGRDSAPASKSFTHFPPKRSARSRKFRSCASFATREEIEALLRRNRRSPVYFVAMMKKKGRKKERKKERKACSVTILVAQMPRDDWKPTRTRMHTIRHTRIIKGVEFVHDGQTFLPTLYERCRQSRARISFFVSFDRP